jgi:hypothetical protein
MKSVVCVLAALLAWPAAALGDQSPLKVVTLVRYPHPDGE